MWCVPASWRKMYSALPFSMVNERCNIYWTGAHGLNLHIIGIVMNAAVLPTVTQNGLTEVVLLLVGWTVRVFCLCMRGEIYMIVAFWVVGPISLIGVFHYIRWSCCILLWFILKVETACCCEVLVTTLRATRFHNPEGHSLYFFILRSSNLIVLFQAAFFLWCFDFVCLMFNA
jgi:hypothetical protein